MHVMVHRSRLRRTLARHHAGPAILEEKTGGSGNEEKWGPCTAYDRDPDGLRIPSAAALNSSQSALPAESYVGEAERGAPALYR